MTTQWIIKTHGYPLIALRNFVRKVWHHFDLDKMLVPLNSGKSATTNLSVIDDPRWLTLSAINPFEPLMTLNAAKLIPTLVKENPDQRIGVMLRPCEMRLLTVMLNRNVFNHENVLSIAIDCLGTFPSDEYQWRVERKGSPQKLTQEVLQFARQGGIVPYRYRSACQMCGLPYAQGADINIGFLGLPVRQLFLIETQNGDVVEKLEIVMTGEYKPEPELTDQRERTLSKMVERRGNTRERVTRSLADWLPTNMSGIAEMLDNCIPCQECLDTCPICSIEYPRQDESSRYIVDDITHWLLACSGCGICEQVCPNHMPLNAVFNHIKERTLDTLDYFPGQIIENTSASAHRKSA